MDDFKKDLTPLTDSLPPEVRDFLDGGGWWVVLAVLGLVVLLLLWALVDRTLRKWFARRLPTLEESDREFHENLVDLWPASGGRQPPVSQPLDQGADQHVADAPRSPRECRLSLYHLPVRLRLVVMAAIGTEAGVKEAEALQLLDRVVPGLGAMAAQEQARIRVWPSQVSQQGFTLAFHRRTQRPEPEGELSNWVLLAGRAQSGRQAILLGLALWTEEPTGIGRLTIDTYQWLDVLRIKTTQE
jgi:hypothetical protein